jgi:hypothetical protein
MIKLNQFDGSGPRLDQFKVETMEEGKGGNE